VEMMDMQAAERWFDQSVELMVAMRKNLESHPKDEPDPLKRELIFASRDYVEAKLKASIKAAQAIIRQMTFELRLSLGHVEKLSALRMANSRYVAERNKTLLLFEQTAPTFPRPAGAAISDDIQAEIDSLSAMSSPTSATTGVRSS
jgi:hypothetical protein